MEIEYLLLLQEIRESWGAFLVPLMDVITKVSVSFFPVAAICIIYWVFDKKAGRYIFAGYTGATVMNGFLKLTCCINRPWVLDSRVEPYGDSKVAATGYSFPSGHSTAATSIYGGIGMWFRKICKWVTVVLFLLIGATMFSRNYLGVHTPKDVIVGCGATVLMMFVTVKIEKWTDEDTSRDKWVLIGSLALCVALIAYYLCKSYPLQYLEDGSLLVDPTKMRADSYEGIGLLSAFSVCRYFERRKFNFDEAMPSWKDRCIVGVIALIPLYFWDTYSIDLLQKYIGRDASKFLCYSFLIVYIMILVPWVMCKIKHIAETINK